MIKRSVALLLLSWIIFQSSAQTNLDKSATIFSVNKRPVTTDEFIYLYSKGLNGRKEETTQAKIDEYLDLLIKFKLKVEEARQRGLDTTKAFIKEYNTYREELRKPYLPDGKLIDSLVELTYNRMKEEVKASHILINVAPDASPEDTLKAYSKIIALRNRILQGEDFGTVAAAFSEEPSAKSSYGNLGYFTAMQMVFPFEQAAYNTPLKTVTMPIRTRFGYHILFVTDRRPAQGEVEVSHIMIRTGDNQDNEKAKSTIFDVYDKLQKGVKWEDLCKEFSQDASSKDTGGKLRPFGIGVMRAVPEFENVAFGLRKVGDFSDPFQTQYGWHIMRLESKIPLPSLADISSSLKAKVARDERVQVSRQAIQTKMKKEYGFNENSAVKSKLFALADSTLTKGKWNVKVNFEKEILFSMLNKSYNVQDFISYAKNNQKATALTPSKYIEQLYASYIESVQNELLEEKIINQNPEYKWLLKEYYEGILLFEIMEKQVWNKASDDSTGQVNYFKNHTNDYKAGERIKGKIYSSPTKATIEELKFLLLKNDSIKIQEFISQQKIRHEKGSFEKSDRPVLSKIQWQPGIYSAENNGSSFLVVVTELLPPGNKTFIEARPSVISDYQNYIEKNWIEELRKKYPVKVEKKVRQKTWNTLLKK
jgi:peptidyl-prolyl cis-trans isomerase SurA